MLHIFLIILKAIGITLLILLTLFIAVTLMVLFVPVCYQVDFCVSENNGKYSVAGVLRASFLGILLRYTGTFDDKTDYKLKLLGITIMSKNQADKKNKKEQKKEAEVEFENETEIDEIFSENNSSVENAENINNAEKMTEKNEDRKEEEPPDKTNGKEYNKKKKNVISSFKKKIDYIKRLFKNSKKNLNKLEKIISYLKECLEDEKFKEAYYFIKEKSICFLKKIFPVVKCANFNLGTDDPALTGKILGAVCAINGMTGQSIIVTPDFDADRFYINGEAALRGKIFIFDIVKLIYYYNFNKKIKYFKKRLDKIRRIK